MKHLLGDKENYLNLFVIKVIPIGITNTLVNFKNKDSFKLNL